MPVRRAAAELLGDWGCRAGRRSAVSDLDLASGGWGLLRALVWVWRLLVSPLLAWQEQAWRPQDEPELLLRLVAAAVTLVWLPWVRSPPQACSPLGGAPVLSVWQQQADLEQVVRG